MELGIGFGDLCGCLPTEDIFDFIKWCLSWESSTAFPSKITRSSKCEQPGHFSNATTTHFPLPTGQIWVGQSAEVNDCIDLAFRRLHGKYPSLLTSGTIFRSPLSSTGSWSCICLSQGKIWCFINSLHKLLPLLLDWLRAVVSLSPLFLLGKKWERKKKKNQTLLAFSIMIGVLRCSGEGRCCVPLIQLESFLSDCGGPELLTASQIHQQAKALLLL